MHFCKSLVVVLIDSFCYLSFVLICLEFSSVNLPSVVCFVCLQLPPYSVELAADLEARLSALLQKLEIQPVLQTQVFCPLCCSLLCYIVYLICCFLQNLCSLDKLASGHLCMVSKI